MKTLLATIKQLGNVNVSITNTSESTCISIKPVISHIKDEAVKIIKPFTITLDQNDSEEDICKLILEFVPKAVEKVNNIKAYEESLDKAESEKKEAKSAADEKEKLKKEFEKDFKSMEECLDPKSPKDETKHTNKFNEFKEKYSSEPKFKDIEKMFNEKYQSLDLFSQI